MVVPGRVAALIAPEVLPDPGVYLSWSDWGRTTEFLSFQFVAYVH
jgi:hypothetical protein